MSRSVECDACDSEDYTHADGGPCCGAEREAWLLGITEGEARGRKLEREAIVADLLSPLELVAWPGERARLARRWTMGEHLAAKGSATPDASAGGGK